MSYCHLSERSWTYFFFFFYILFCLLRKHTECQQSMLGDWWNNSKAKQYGHLYIQYIQSQHRTWGFHVHVKATIVCYSYTYISSIIMWRRKSIVRTKGFIFKARRTSAKGNHTRAKYKSVIMWTWRTCMLQKRVNSFLKMNLWPK